MTDTTQASTAAGGLPGGWLRNFEEIVACTALTVVVLSTSWGVFTRYVSAQPATWSAEIAAVGFCWAIFLGSAAAFKPKWKPLRSPTSTALPPATSSLTNCPW